MSGLGVSALEKFVRAAMASGFACIAERVGRGEVDKNAPLTDALRDFPAEFLRIRADLVDLVRDELQEDS